jgi:hypothetical protein
MSKANGLALLAVALLAVAVRADSATLREERVTGKNVVRHWSLTGTPKGVAVGPDDTIYVGLASPQSVVAIDPLLNRIVREKTLDREEIASTKDFATLRIGRRGTRLYVAQGSDESVTILALPELTIEREILVEGERIRDALPDPAGRFLYVLGRDVHVYDIEGKRLIRKLRDLEPLAIASNAAGSTLAVVGFEQFPNGRATMIALYDTSTLTETRRIPLQTDRAILATFFAAADEVIVTVAADWLGEAQVRQRREPAASGTSADETMRLRIEPGDLVSSESVCLPDGAGPQIATPSRAGDLVVFAEKRCASGASFAATKRRTKSVSIYGINAYAMARTADSLYVATDPKGSLTIYRQPEGR